MVMLDSIPTSSISWSLAMLGCLIIGVKSFLRYRVYRVELSKYVAWFAIIMSAAIGMLALPSFFTLDLHVLNRYYMAAEFLFYSSMTAQSAIVWCLLLRSRFRLYQVTGIVGLIGLVAWINAFRLSYVSNLGDFLAFNDPRPLSFVIAGLMIGLFTPVGLYFLKVAPQQQGSKAIFTSATIGVVYVGIGLITGALEIFYSRLMTPGSIAGETVFFVFLLIAALWPRRGASFTGREVD